MAGFSICEIDFDDWVNLALSDPDAFEALRESKISAYLEKVSDSRKQRMRCLQWKIDKIREKNKDSALAACYTISELMWETFDHLRNVLHSSEAVQENHPQHAASRLDELLNRPIPDNIIPFSIPHHSRNS